LDTDKVPQNKNISGLSFREILTQQDNSVYAKSDLESFLYVDDDINAKKFTKKVKKFFYRIYINRVKKGRKGFFSFLFSFTNYLYARVRVFVILFSVISSIFFKAFESIKNNLTRRMFWGRGNFLGSALQVVALVVMFIVAISYLYRKPVVIVASEGHLDRIGVAETDIMVMNASLNTLIPKDRARRSVEEYIVKGGDTLSTIAEYYGISTESILWANNMGSSDYIKPGQKLEIPPSDGVIIEVAKGDTIASLAKKYNANEQSIADFNWLDYPFELLQGQTLFIPDGKMPAPPQPTYAATPSFYVSNQYTSASASAAVGDPNVGRFISWPVAGGAGVISQYYKPWHRAIDIASRALPNITAAAPGTVIFAGCSGYCPPLGSTYGGSGYAWSIQVDHGNGYTTWYAHLKNIYVRSGQSVARGEAIGQMGSTGRSTGPHVHFELRRGVAFGTQVNPLGYSNW
jgi:murein DD-endopeptidase MepM/ murein hydrolase activator NlpD